MLRASSDHNGDDINLNILTNGKPDNVSIPHSDLLIALAEAVLADDAASTAAARASVQAAMGDKALVDAAGIIGMFNGLDRVADATGAPLEDWKAADTAAMRLNLGIDAFAATKAALETS